MSYNSDSGIISAPVSIDDVKQALGESSNDLATLCKSENINIWSKYKPISCKGEFKEYPIREDSDEIVTSSYSKYTCVVRCGMNIPMDTYKNLRYNYGGEGFAIKACGELYKDNVYGVRGIDKDASTNSHTVYASGKHSFIRFSSSSLGFSCWSYGKITFSLRLFRLTSLLNLFEFTISLQIPFSIL